MSNMPHSSSYFGASDVGRKSDCTAAAMALTLTCLQRLVAVFVGLVFVLARGADSPPSSNEVQRRKEEIHFLQCLAFVYDPAMWLSYQDNLYFMPRTDDQIERLGQM